MGNWIFQQGKLGFSDAERGYFVTSGDIIHDFYGQSYPISNIITEDISAISYSTDQINWNSISLPYSGSIQLTGDVYWTCTLTEGKSNGFLYVVSGRPPTYNLVERAIYFTGDLLICRDYYVNQITVDSILAKDIATLEYSTDGASYTSVTLPYVSGLELTGNIWWRVTLVTDRTDGFLYLNNGVNAIQSKQSREILFNKEMLTRRDLFYSPVIVKDIYLENASGVEYSMDYGARWQPLVRDSMLADNIWFKVTQINENIDSYLYLGCLLDTNQHEVIARIGQSNQLGNDQAPQDDVYGSSFPKVFTNGWYHSNPSLQWETLIAGVNASYNQGTAGPETGFSGAFVADIANKNKYLFIWKFAEGGTMLYPNTPTGCWLPIDTGIFNDAFTIGLFPAMLTLLKRKFKIKLKAICQMHGESDSQTALRANAWLDNITLLFSTIDSQWSQFCTDNNLTYIPFIKCIIKPKIGVTGETYVDTVRGFDDQYASVSANNAFVTDANDHVDESGADVHHLASELVAIGIDEYNSYKLHKI